MRRESAKSARRAACLSLALLALFLSYRPAITFLSMAGAAKNPSDSRLPGPNSEIDARENLPRPAKAQQQEAHGRVVQKIQKSRTISADEKTLLKLVMLGFPPTQAGTISGPSKTLERDLARPDYLRLFLPATPGSPQSPPA